MLTMRLTDTDFLVIGREEGSENSINIPEAQAHLEWILDMIVQQLLTQMHAQGNSDGGNSYNSNGNTSGDSHSGSGGDGDSIQMPDQLQQILGQVTSIGTPTGGETSGGSGGSPVVPVNGGSGVAAIAQSLLSSFNGHQGGQQASAPTPVPKTH